MAPEPRSLKRKRSRPSEWWAAAASSSSAPQLQRDELASKKRAKPTQDVSQNTGRARSSVKTAEFGSSRPSDAGRKRLSDGEDELIGLSGSEEQVATHTSRGEMETILAGAARDIVIPTLAQSRKVHAAFIESIANPVTDVGKRRWHPPKDQTQGSAAREPEHEDLSTRKKQKSAPQDENIVARGRQETEKIVRRGRSSHTEAEVQAIYEQAVYRSKRVAEKVRQPEEPVKSSFMDSARSPVVQGSARENTEKPDSGGGRRGRSSNAEAEVHALFEQATRPQYKSKIREKGSSQNPSSTNEPAVKLLGKSKRNILQDVDHGSGRRGRSSNTVAEVQAIFAEATKPVYKGSRKDENHRGRRSGTVLEVEAATSTFGKDNGKRKKQAPAATPVDDASNSRAKHAQPAADQTHPSKPGRKEKRQSSSKPYAKSQNTRQQDRVSKQSPKRHRKEKAAQPEDDRVSEAEDVAAYQQLTAVTRKISRQTMESKWEALPTGCIERISLLLEGIQRPVVGHFSDEIKIQASAALQLVSRKIVNKISKGLPFPQGTRNHREDDFDFEKILDHNRSLEALLTPALHATKLLEAKLGKETALLEADREVLEELQANAQREASMRKDAGRRTHALLVEESPAGEQNTMEQLGLNHSRSLPPSFDVAADEHLESIVKDMSDHMESMESNISQVRGISEAVARSKAAVQATLFKNLGSNEYEDTVLG